MVTDFLIISTWISWTADSGAESLPEDAWSFEDLLHADDSSIDSWEYIQAPSVSAVEPAAGQIGTKVTVTGTGLLGGGSSIVSASFGTVLCTSVESATDTKVVVVAGAYVREGCPGDEYLFEGECTGTCGAGTFESGSTEYDRICEPCHGTCSECTGPAAAGCHGLPLGGEP